VEIEQVAQAIGVPVSGWAKNCDLISHLIVKSGVLEGLGHGGGWFVVRRGHWLGPIGPRSAYADRAGLPFHAHSWIQGNGLSIIDPVRHKQLLVRTDTPSRTDLADAMIVDPIIDPTRFAFTGEAPFIYIGPSDYYDAGGNRWRMATMRSVPVPSYRAQDQRIELDLPHETWRFIAMLVAGNGYPFGVATFPMLMWVGNLPLQVLGDHAKPIFQALVRAGHGAIAPLDNRRLVLGE